MAATVKLSCHCVSWRRVLVAGVAIVGVLAAASFVWAGNTGTTALFKPIGNTASSASGDYISTSSGGLNSYYTYFIEVPLGQGRLVVDVFDADNGAGGAADLAGNRDWDYAGTSGFTGTTTYSIYNPSGVQQATNFSQGTSTLPVGADNNWLTFFDSNNATGTYLDQFLTQVYSGNNGTRNWVTNWTETGETTNPTAGLIQVANDTGQPNFQLRLQGPTAGTTRTIARQADLSAVGSATLTYRYRRVLATSTSTYRDNFGAQSYANNDGTANWSTDWAETGDTGGATGGDIRVVTDTGQSAYQLRFQGGGNTNRIRRSANLSAAGSATLTFRYRRDSLDDATDQVLVEVSPDNNNWTTLDTYSGPATDASYTNASYTIPSAVFSATTYVRISDVNLDSDDRVWFDDIQIQASEAADQVLVETSPDGTAWSTLATISGPGTDATYVNSGSLAIPPADFSATTRVRFSATTMGTGDSVWIDDVQIQSTGVSAGHWELRVSLPASGGDEINGFGLRAHDGDATDAGTECNVYYQPYTQFGTDNANNGGTDTVDFVNYPWVTSGCSCYANNWDGDGAGTFAFDRPDRSTSPATWVQVGGTITASGATVWGHDAITGWTSNPDAASYGIWRLRHQSIEWSAGAGNIYTFYMTDYNNSTVPPPPPTTQQQANSMRVYLPTDTGDAPLKPYAEQFVRRFYASEITPPQVGVPHRATVTVRVVNPTPHSITFSSSNLVTVNVPGTIAGSGTVVHRTPAGFPQVSQGAIVTALGDGASGTMTWNPGTLAAGGTALLAYVVDATPSVAGTLRVTGTPASGGTTARYVDETGSSAARALVTLGPLCQVAISTNEPTQAVLAGLWSHRHADGLVVSWMTASEVGTAGYRLERLSRTGNTFEVATDQAFLPALPAAPQGAVYHVVDRGADARAPQTYRIVEIEATGSERDLGTYTLTPEDGPAPMMAASFLRTPRERRPAPELPAGSDPLTAAPVAGVKIAVESPGLYRLGADDIATQLAVPVDEVRARIQTRGYALSNRGEAVAWLPGADGSGLYFVGEPLDSIYSRANVYVLKPGAGVLMMPPFTRQLPADRPLRVSATTLHTESDLFELTAAPLDPESDYWFWDYLEAGSATHGRRPFTIVAPSVSPAGGQATLVAQLLGATSTGVAGEHHAVVHVNGVQVGEASWQGIAAHQVTATFDQSLLREGANTVEVEARLESGVPYGFVFVDSFDLTYQRLHTAQASALEVAVAGSRAITIDGFADPAIRVFDLGNPKRPTTLLQVQVATGSAGFVATFSTPMPTGSGLRRLLAVSESGIRHPARIWPDAASSLRSTGNAADVLVVTAGPLVTAAGELAAYRQGQGVAALVVDIEDVYDEFNAGLPSPHALRSFLAHARDAWTTAPRTVVLAGTGSYDYKDVLGLGGNLVPPLMVSSPGGIFASDARFGDLAGDDGVPEIAIGRLPVATPAELADAITKIAAYEAEGAAAWTGAAVVVADDPEDGFDFGLDSDTLASRLGGLVTEKLYLGPLTATEVHTRLLSAWNDGAAVVTYLGHGGMDRWAQESIFSVPDVATLGNGPRLPLVASLTCVIGRFEVPGFECLGSALMKPSAAGAIGVWAPSGVANHADSLLLGQMFSESIGRHDVPTIGDACIRALADFHAGGGNPTTAVLYNYFGDPMIRLRSLPPPPPPEPGGDPGAP